MKAHISVTETDAMSILEEKELVNLLLKDLTEKPENQMILEDLED